MPNPPLRRNFINLRTPAVNELPAADYNAHAQRTDIAYDVARAALINARVQIADNCYAAPAAGSAFNISTAGTYEFFYNVGMDASDLRIGFGQWSNTIVTGVHTDIDSATSVTFSAAIKDASGSVYQLTFGGQKTVTLVNGLILSDSIPIDVVKGDIIYVRVYISAGTAHWNRLAFKNASITNAGGFSSGVDYTLTGSPALPTPIQASGWGPMLIIGIPKAKDVTPKSIIIQGDSIAWGAFDGFTGDLFTGAMTNQPILLAGGWIARCLAGQAGVINAALQGDGIGYFLAGLGHFRRASLINYARYALIEYGVNDINLDHTAAQIQADLLTQANRNLNKGIIANIIVTLTPQSTSTDRWTTLGNQTPITENSVRVTHNNWVRDGGPIDATTKTPVATGTSTNVLRFGAVDHPIHGYLEVADCIESARDSGKWKIADRVVTNAAITTGTATLTSTTANFTSADIGKCVIIAGAGAAGVDLVGTILSINSSTSVAITQVASVTVSGATCVIGAWTADGVHPRCNGHAYIAAQVQASFLALMS
jgi:hypothetical protein